MADQSNEDDDTSRIPPSDIWNNGLHNNQHTSPAQSPLEENEEDNALQQHPPLSNGGFASEQYNTNSNRSSNGLSSILTPHYFISVSKDLPKNPRSRKSLRCRKTLDK